MSTVDTLAMHAQHREAKWEHRQWLEDIARWRKEHHQAAAMLAAIKAAWDKAEVALEKHAQQIRAHEEHLDRHEQAVRDHGWTVDDFEEVEHREFEVAHAAARKAHAEMQHLHSEVMTEVFELLKLTHPGAVVLETG